MPQYTIEDSQTGRTLTVEGDAPPSQQDATELFAAQPKESKDSILKSAGVGLASSAGGVAGAWAGAETAMAAAAPYAAATANPFTAGAIEIGSGLVGAIGGSMVGSKIQDKILPDRIKAVIQKSHEDNPVAFDVGELAGGAAAFKPGLNANGWADIVGGRFGTKAAQKAAVGLGLGAGLGIAQPLVQGQKPTGEDVVMSVLMASLLGEARGGNARIGTMRMEAVREQAAKIAKTLTPEERAHIQTVAATGMSPKDHQMVADAAQGKNVYVMKPDEETAVLQKVTTKDVDKASQSEVDRIFTGEEHKNEITLSRDEAAPGGHEKVQAIADKYNLSWDEAVEVLAKNRERLGIVKDVAHDELSEEESLAKEIEAEEASPIKGEHLRAMADAGVTKGQMAKVKTIGDVNKAIEIAKAQKSVAQSIQKTEETAPPERGIPEAAKPAFEPPKQDALDVLFNQLDDAKTKEDVFKVVDGPESAKLPQNQQDILKGRGREVSERLEAEKAIQDAIDQEAGLDPNNAPFSETRSPDQQEADRIAEAGRSGAIATWDPKGNRVLLFPRNLSKKMDFMRAQGFSDNYIRNTLKSVIAHEEIHGATTRATAADYWNSLSRFERWAHEQIYPSGTLRSNDAAYMGMEAIRMRMQDILKMTPDELSELSGTFRLKLDTIYSLQKAVRSIRENLLDRAAKGRSLAILKEVELRLNFAEAIARSRSAGIQNFAETRGQGDYDKIADDLDDAAKEYEASGDRQSADELTERAKWLRQKQNEQFFPFSETRAPKYIGTAPVFVKRDGTKVGGFRMFNIQDPIYDRQTGEMLHSENSTVSEDTLRNHGIPIPGDQNAETRAQDKFGFDTEFEPKMPVPPTPEQQVEARRLQVLSNRLYDLERKPLKTDADHATIRKLEEELGQSFMPFSETRAFDFDDERKPVPRKTFEPKQPDLFAKAERGVKPLTSTDKKRIAAEKEQEAEIARRKLEVAIAAGEGDFTQESVMVPQASSIEGDVKRVVDAIVDRRLKALTGEGGKPRSLEQSMNEFLRAFSRATGLPKGHLQILGQQAFWDKINHLSVEQVDALYHFEIGAGKNKLDAMKQAMRNFPMSETEPVTETAIEELEQPEKKMTDAQFRAAWIRMSESEKAAIVQARDIAKETEKKEVFAKGVTHEPPPAVVKRQDVDYLRAETQKSIRRKAMLYFKFIKPLLRETDFQRPVAPEDIQYGGHTDKEGHHTGGIETFYASSQKDPEGLSKELLNGWQRNVSDPKTATQRLVVLQSKTGPEVYMVSIYKRGTEAYILDPLSPNKEHAPLADVMKRYDVRHSIMLDAPVTNFKQRFGDYKDFKTRFFDEAQQRLMKSESYGQDPMSLEQAIAESPMGMRLEDELGHEVDATDPQAEEKIHAQRQSELEQLREENQKLEHKREAEGEDIPFGKILKNRQRIKDLEKPARIQRTARSFRTGVRKGEGKIMTGPLAGVARSRADIGEKGIERHAPLTEQQTGALYDFLNTELKGKPASAEDVEAILMGAKFSRNPNVVNAINKYGKQAFKDFWESARQFIRDQKAKGNKPVAVEPKLEGYRLVRESARRLFRALQSSPDRESFVRNILRAVNGPAKVEVKETGEVAPTGKELTYGPYQYPKRGMERAQQVAGTSPAPQGRLAFSSQREPLNVPDRPSPEIPQATTTPRQEQYLEMEDQAALSEYIRKLPQDPELPVYVPPEEMQESQDFLSKSHTLFNELVNNPGLPVSHYSTFQSRLQAIKAGPKGARLTEEAGRPQTPQFALTRAGEALERAKLSVHAWQSGRGNKDTLARGMDAAGTMAANGAIKSANEVRVITMDRAKLDAMKALVSAGAVSRTYQYAPEAIVRAKELVEGSDQVKLAKAMRDNNISQTKILLKKIYAEGSDIGGQDKAYLQDLENKLNNNLVSTEQLFTLGSQLQSMVRRGLESQLVDEGLLTHADAQYAFDPSQVDKLDVFHDQVKSGLEKAKAMQGSANAKERSVGKQWEAYNNGLLKELEFARNNWKDEAMQKGSIAYIKEMDQLFDYEKANGSDIKFNDANIPGRYNADAFNNDYIVGGQRVLGKRFGLPKTFANYYEAASAGPYMALNTDISALLEHRVRAGLNRVNTKLWEDGWKSMKDEHADAPVAVGVRKIGNREVADVPKGVDATRYERVDLSGGGSMFVLYGYHRFYKQLTNPSEVMNWGPSRLALQASQFLKHQLLAGDFFHFFRVGYYAAAINGVGGLARLSRPGWAALEFRESQLDAAVKSGMIDKDIADWARKKVPFNAKGNKGSISRIELAERLQKNGLNTGQIMDALYRDLSSHMPILGGLNARYNRFLFDKWTRGLMNRSALQEFERIQTANPDMDSDGILKTVARDMNNFFGSIGRQGWIKSRTWQDISRMVVLAPQWLEGLVKKDFSIPYKFATGINNGGALKVLKGQESMARGMTRGLLMMAAMTQVMNLITNRKPTWENEDKEHKFDAEISPGVFISPLAVYNEILHDIIRYSETKPKVWDAISQIGENKMSFYSRAALIAATDKSPTGEYQTTSLGVAREIGKSMVPLPITLKGPATLAYHGLTGRGMNPQDVKSTMAITGVKAEVQRSVVSRVQQQASQFAQANHLKSDMEVMTPTDEPSYQKLRRSLEMNDMKGAQGMYQELLKNHRQPQISQAMKQWENRPFTGSRKNEVLWLHSMDDQGRAQYQQALVYRRGLYQKWVTFFIDQRA